MPDKPLLSISEASQLLGVSEGSLRQWTDDGLIKAFVTPGGHRRYNQADLNRFRKTHPRMLSLKDLVAELKETTPKHREAGRIPFKDKKHVLNEESQELFANLGRQMLDLIIKHITEPNSREETIELIRSVGRQHGEILFKKGLSLTDSIEAFILHRDPIMSSITRLTEKSDIITGRIVEKIPMVARLMDEALVALVDTYQKHRNKT